MGVRDSGLAGFEGQALQARGSHVPLSPPPAHVPTSEHRNAGGPTTGAIPGMGCQPARPGKARASVSSFAAGLAAEQNARCLVRSGHCLRSAAV